MPSPTQLGRYEIETSRSAVTFSTRHLSGLAPVRGSFAIRSGTIDVAEPLAESTVRAQIDAASFRTRTRPRDRAVVSARFLDAAAHPVMTFISERTDASAVTGTLTFRGVTRPVSLSIEQSEVSPGSLRVRATTRIDRTEFGMTASGGLAGRYLDVSVEVQCVRK